MLLVPLRIIIFIGMVKLLDVDENPRKIAFTYTFLIAVLYLFLQPFSLLGFVFTLGASFALSYLVFFLMTRSDGWLWWVTVIIGFFLLGII